MDKLAKIGPGRVRDELVAAGVDAGRGRAACSIDRSIRLKRVDPCQYSCYLPRRRPTLVAVDNLGGDIQFARCAGAWTRLLPVDLSLARGLDYYTGIVYEATVDEPKVGSVSGGGRYDGLMGMFAGRDIPAMGVSIGLERIIEVAEEFNLIEAPKSVCDVIVIFHERTLDFAAGIARDLRARGFNVDLSLLDRKSFGDQLKYADRRGIPIAVLVGENEAAEQVATSSISPAASNSLCR